MYLSIFEGSLGTHIFVVLDEAIFYSVCNSGLEDGSVDKGAIPICL